MIQFDYSPTPVTGLIFTQDNGSSTVSNSTVSGVNGTFLVANANRKSFTVQNLSSGVGYLKLGDSAASNNYNVVLKRDTITGSQTVQGDGGIYTDNKWKGNVSYSGANPNFISWELT